MCEKQNVLPIGISEDLKIARVKVYCPRCKDIYSPKKKSADADGAFFGTSFPFLLLMVLQFPSRHIPISSPTLNAKNSSQKSLASHQPRKNNHRWQKKYRNLSQLARFRITKSNQNNRLQRRRTKRKDDNDLDEVDSDDQFNLIKKYGVVGNRTPGLLNANQALYQLSYNPVHKP